MYWLLSSDKFSNPIDPLINCKLTSYCFYNHRVEQSFTDLRPIYTRTELGFEIAKSIVDDACVLSRARYSDTNLYVFLLYNVHTLYFPDTDHVIFSRAFCFLNFMIHANISTCTIPLSIDSWSWENKCEQIISLYLI